MENRRSTYKVFRKISQVEWWFKNGDRDVTFFAIPYLENGEQKPSYVDFIVRFKNRSLGLFDTKSGRAIKDAREKSDGLQKYLKEHKGIIGGIMTNTNSNDFSGRWMCYKGQSSELNPDDSSDWELLEI